MGIHDIVIYKIFLHHLQHVKLALTTSNNFEYIYVKGIRFSRRNGES